MSYQDWAFLRICRWMPVRGGAPRCTACWRRGRWATCGGIAKPPESRKVNPIGDKLIRQTDRTKRQDKRPDIKSAINHASIERTDAAENCLPLPLT
jgi:hypothetical protein